jgi:hypothetical protein
MFDLKNLDKKKQPNIEFSGGKREVKYLQPYFLQGGKWHKLKIERRPKNGSRRLLP